MKVLEKQPLALADVKAHIKDVEEKKDLLLYLKKFTILSPQKAKALAEEIRALKNVKIKEEDIIAVLNFLPKDAEDVNKIFIDVSLSQEEINQILEIVKKYGA
ncbi:DNA-directed RNA polymerase subunit F [Candidatus Pacearchaeota archaeon]|nr:DNA-directed RNA polymerase subunit F [Candidatus Pacearchaeota archaeon]|tara:strand:- start:632 stop:940 length:309 start_codon:yes stop_codon:yes gene_type:complete